MPISEEQFCLFSIVNLPGSPLSAPLSACDFLSISEPVSLELRHRQGSQQTMQWHH